MANGKSGRFAAVQNLLNAASREMHELVPVMSNEDSREEIEDCESQIGEIKRQVEKVEKWEGIGV